MVTVRISETYDLSTKVGKMGIVGIHTPRGGLLNRLYGGLIPHYSKFRFVKCDVAMACASMLPADPLQIGVEAGSIAPQDMFNPILYKAVSNDSMTNVLSYVMSKVGGSGADAALNKGSVVDINNTAFDGVVDQFSTYYGLLSDDSGWRKAMPQSGLVMKGLFPLVYQVVSSYGSNQVDPNTMNFPTQVDSGLNGMDTDGSAVTSIVPYQFRGPAMRMPSVDTTYFIDMPDDYQSSNLSTWPGDSIVIVNSIGPKPSRSLDVTFLGDNTQGVPPCYVGLIILPPAKLNQLYYRLKVTWTVEFTGLRSLADVTTWRTLTHTGSESYGTDYVEQSSKMTANTAMVDTLDADIQKVMEGS